LVEGLPHPSIGRRNDQAGRQNYGGGTTRGLSRSDPRMQNQFNRDQELARSNRRTVEIGPEAARNAMRSSEFPRPARFGCGMKNSKKL